MPLSHQMSQPSVFSPRALSGPSFRPLPRPFSSSPYSGSPHANQVLPLFSTCSHMTGLEDSLQSPSGSKSYVFMNAYLLPLLPVLIVNTIFCLLYLSDSLTGPPIPKRLHTVHFFWNPQDIERSTLLKCCRVKRVRLIFITENDSFMPSSLLLVCVKTIPYPR